MDQHPGVRVLEHGHRAQQEVKDMATSILDSEKRKGFWVKDGDSLLCMVSRGQMRSQWVGMCKEGKGSLEAACCYLTVSRDYLKKKQKNHVSDRWNNRSTDGYWDGRMRERSSIS